MSASDQWFVKDWNSQSEIAKFPPLMNHCGYSGFKLIAPGWLIVEIQGICWSKFRMNLIYCVLDHI